MTDQEIFAEMQIQALATKPRLAIPPNNPAEGDMYLDTNDHLIVFVEGQWYDATTNTRCNFGSGGE